MNPLPTHTCELAIIKKKSIGVYMEKFKPLYFVGGDIYYGKQYGGSTQTQAHITQMHTLEYYSDLKRKKSCHM